MVFDWPGCHGVAALFPDLGLVKGWCSYRATVTDPKSSSWAGQGRFPSLQATLRGRVR